MAMDMVLAKLPQSSEHVTRGRRARTNQTPHARAQTDQTPDLREQTPRCARKRPSYSRNPRQRPLARANAPNYSRKRLKRVVS